MSEKLKKAVLPTRKPVAKSKKLGLLSNPHRKMVTFRMTPSTIEKLKDLVKRKRHNRYHGITMTEVLEMAVLRACDMTEKDFSHMVYKYRLDRDI